MSLQERVDSNLPVVMTLGWLGPSLDVARLMWLMAKAVDSCSCEI